MIKSANQAPPPPSDEGKLPLISIIIAVYNGAKTLQRCIDSITSQTYSNIELIIIDGASTDGTVDIIKENEEVIAYWNSEPDKGIADAWNKALKVMRGDWFLILGADDYLNNENVLLSFVNSLKSNQGRLVIYGEVNRVNAIGKVIEANDGGEWSTKRFLSRPMYVCHQSIFCDASLINKIGGFDESLRTAMDYDFVLRSLAFTRPKYLKGFIVSNFTLGGVSGSVDDILIMHKEVMFVKKKNGYKAIQGYYYFLLMKTLIKYIIQKIFGSKIRIFVINVYRKTTGRQATHE